MISETRFVGFWASADNREDHLNMAPCWAGGRGSKYKQRMEGSWGRQQKRPIFTKLYPCVFFFCTQVLQLLPPQQTEKVASHFKSSPKNVQRSIFYVLSGFSYCVWQCDRSDKAMQKGGCTWDPGNFITPSQAVSVQDPGLCAGCPALRTGNMAQTTLCVIATSRRALWYVHLPWLVLQIALMSLPPCLCSLDSSH